MPPVGQFSASPAVGKLVRSAPATAGGVGGPDLPSRQKVVRHHEPSEEAECVIADQVPTELCTSQPISGSPTVPPHLLPHQTAIHDPATLRDRCVDDLLDRVKCVIPRTGGVGRILALRSVRLTLKLCVFVQVTISRYALWLLLVL